MDMTVFRSRLLALQTEIESLIKGSEESRKPVELDQASVGRLSRMDAMQHQAMAMATQRQRQNDLLRIRAALRRIEEGEYGYCSVCGGEIAAARLELDPATPTCIHCAVNRK
ncbi:TraR/DksA family transcriptional regulator [Aestuariivirga sp.]|uniref:TraR/DksA family transcriptional regulator n=1 Tax=Aestuariivirga sp. TaxID=2650926 RepID=UPI00391A8C26